MRYQPAPSGVATGRREEPTIGAAGFLPDPPQKAVTQGKAAGPDEVDKKAVGLQVMHDMPAVIARILGPPEVGSGEITVQIGQESCAPWRDEQEGRTPGYARGFDHLPAVDQPMVFEELEAELSGSSAGKEELLGLESGEVAVVVEGLKYAAVSLGERSEKSGGLLLGERSGGVLGNGAKNERASRNRSPSWYERPRRLNTLLNSRVVRSSRRSLKRRPE